MLAALSSRIQDYIFRPQTRECPPILLHRRRIYILPTGHGIAYALMLLVLFIGSINYTLSLGYVLTFFLAALGNVAILHTFRNLRGLTIRWRVPEPVFAGDTAMFPLLLAGAAQDARFAVAAWGSIDNPRLLDVPAAGGLVRLSLPADRRGRLALGRVVIESRYPLGLFRAWSRISPDVHCIVYPRPAADEMALPASSADGGARAAYVAGNDEYQFLRGYRAGDSPRRISWHAYARGRGLLTKQFAADSSGEVVLDLDAAPGEDLEEKLSRLARWVLDAEVRGICYGLRLADDVTAAGLGDAHRRKCLEKLAQYGLNDAAA